MTDVQKRLISQIKVYIRHHKHDLQGYKDLFSVLMSCDAKDKKIQWHWRDLRKMISRVIRLRSLTAEQVIEFARFKETVLLAMAKWDVDSYFQYMEKNRPIEKRFYLPRREGLKPMIEGFQALIDDELDFLAISMPPRTGKTSAAIFFVSMMMGLHPDGTILASGHSSILTNSFFSGALELITSPDYTWNEIFPECFLAEKNAKETTLNLNKAGRMKTLTCRSIDGSLTGACDANTLLYADDLVSGIEEALSKDRLDKLWDKGVADLKSRMIDKCKELHVATRWSCHDVIGRYENEMAGNPRARFIKIPALDENGHSNFNYGNHVGFSDEYYLERKRIMDDATFRALYQNEPIEREGLLYHTDELRRFYDLPNDPANLNKVLEPDAIISIADTKDKGKDYFFSPVAYVYGDDYYIVDCICDDGVNGLEAKTAALYKKHGVQMSRFESNSAGGKIADITQSICREIHAPTHITKKFTSSNKETRIITESTWVKEHCLFLDSSKYEINSEYGDMMKMLTSYTQKGKNNFDDVPDGFSMLSKFARSLKGNKAEAVDNPLYRPR